MLPSRGRVRVVPKMRLLPPPPPPPPRRSHGTVVGPASSSSSSCSSNSNTGGGRSPRPVVSSFLSVGTPHSAAFRVALFKRSRTAGPYAGLWAACSGSIEPGDADPVAAALREIREETSLGEEELELLREGEAFGIRGTEPGTGWRIWPFVWSLKGAKGVEDVAGRVVLDAEEHDEVRWVALGEVDGMDTVEGLGGTLRRMLASGRGSESQ